MWRSPTFLSLDKVEGNDAITQVAIASYFGHDGNLGMWRLVCLTVIFDWCPDSQHHVEFCSAKAVRSTDADGQWPSIVE
jgi:hypothetical protein